MPVYSHSDINLKTHFLIQIVYNFIERTNKYSH